MKSALIGYTGFVGGNLYNQHEFTDVYNSTNIGDIEGKEYDIVYSAANKAEMWRINQEPDKDLAEIEAFIGHIAKVTIKKLVLISTVGVYKDPNGANEDTVIETDGLSPYGKNRYHLESYCRQHFDTTIVRLPGLYGEGLKKNVIYDLLHNNNVDRIHKDGAYQYYDLGKIYHDISIALDNNLSLVNFATPPVSTAVIAKKVFNIEFVNMPNDVKPVTWDMHTKYGRLYGGDETYMCSLEAELNSIRTFVAHELESQR